MRRVLQEIKGSVILTLKDCLSHTALLFEISLAPFVYTLVAMYLYRDLKSSHSLLYVLLGAGSMGIWESTLLGGAWALRDEREMGTLEYTVCAPSRLLSVVFGKCLVYSFVGLLILFEVLVIVLFNYDLSGYSIHFPKMLLSFILLMLSFSVIGYMLSFGFLLTRSFIYVSNFLADGIKVFCGILFPISVLPSIFKAVSFVLPGTWAMEIARSSLIKQNGSYLSTGVSIVLLTVLSFTYILITVLFSKIIERKILQKGELAKF